MHKLLQKTFRWFFMHAENTFNHAFGDKQNPFYHLGTITFWQFWLLVVTGLYLYIFADTGVHDAFDSVERITHDQWWAGGIMRSVHRYATDGMILTMLLHMLRHFAYDRYRGFRWFSWATGVALVWMVYIAGINGFMLVWDQLAQFIVVAVAEWFDVLPIFNGTLIRNFLYQGSVNSRLFTLLAFIHIGAPLIVVFVMWIHVQRVPKAHINPPRAIAIAVTLMFVVLSLVKPVVSQGGEADFSVVPNNLEFDWFELPVLALVYAWDPLKTWFLVVGLSAFLFVVPWLPPLRNSTGAAGIPVTFHPDHKAINVRFGETLLDAGLRHGLPLPYECRNGGCGVCKCTVVSGKVDPGIYQANALTAEELAQGKILLCCATAVDVAEVEYVFDASRQTVQEYYGRIAGLDKLAHDVMRVVIALPETSKVDFKAGQYLNVVLEDGQRRAFSFATAPQHGNSIELHVRLIPGGRFTTHVFEKMKIGDAIRFEAPLGDFVLQESDRPIIFVAGATGFAPVKSMLEDAFRRGITRPMYLYWGVRQQQDLYMPDVPVQWEKEHANFKFVPVVSDPAPEDRWSGRTGLVHEAILQDFSSLAGHEIYACGSVKMVDAILPQLKAQGAEDGLCFSDAFMLSAKSQAGLQGT